MTVIEQILLQKKMIDEGIIPYADTDVNQDFQKVLAQLSPEDARRSKRKFRKVWRSIMQNKMRTIATNHANDPLMKFGKERMLQMPLGISKCILSKQNKLKRKVFVFEEMKKQTKKLYDKTMNTLLEST
jgi:hypothetical protein